MAAFLPTLGFDYFANAIVALTLYTAPFYAEAVRSGAGTASSFFSGSAPLPSVPLQKGAVFRECRKSSAPGKQPGR